MYLRLLYFSIIWIKIPDGYQIASLEELDLWSTSQLSLWIGVFTRRSELSFHYLLSKVIFFILSTLYIEHCLSILPLFVAICEIWLSGLTYGVNLVLFLKPGATIVLGIFPIFLFFQAICIHESTSWSTANFYYFKFYQHVRRYVYSITWSSHYQLIHLFMLVYSVAPQFYTLIMCLHCMVLSTAGI